MKVAIEVSYTMANYTVFDLPEGKTLDDVKDYHVRWGTLFLTFDDGSKLQLETNEATLDNVDFKFPDRATFFPVDEDGYPVWEYDPSP